MFLYYWVEEEAPRGYEAASDIPHYFVMFDADENAAIEAANQERAKVIDKGVQNNNTFEDGSPVIVNAIKDNYTWIASALAPAVILTAAPGILARRDLLFPDGSGWSGGGLGGCHSFLPGRCRITRQTLQHQGAPGLLGNGQVKDRLPLIIQNEQREQPDKKISGHIGIRHCVMEPALMTADPHQVSFLLQRKKLGIIIQALDQNCHIYETA